MIRKTLVTALMLALCGSASAAGLGRINVLSTLGQPLRAEIELSSSGDELDSMVVRMASAEAYQRAHIDFGNALTGIKATIEKRGGRSVVKITSDKPISEPFMDLLIDMNWSGGHLQREYTFLLDPAEMPGPKALPQTTQPVSRPVESKLDSRPVPSKPDSKPAVESGAAPRAAAGREKPQREAAQDGSEYTTQRGDSLYKIAADLRSGEITQEQMLAALYRANSDAFVGGNINRLRVGRILKVPASDEVSNLAPREAHKIVLKANNFEQYRQTVAAAAPTQENAGGQSAGGKVAPKVVESAAPAQPKDKVTVTATTAANGKQTGTAAASTDSGASKARIQSLMDENASQQKRLQEAESRVKQLEANIDAQNKLLKLKSDALAQAEAAAKAAEERAKKANGKKSNDVKDAAASKPAVETATAKPEAVVEASKPAVVEPAPVVESAPSADASQAAAATSAPAAEPAPAPAPVPVVAASHPTPAPAPVEEESFFSNYWAIGGLGLVVALLAFVFVKQRRKQAAAGTGNTQLSEASTSSPNSVFGNAGGQTVDTGGTSLLHTDFSQSGMSAIDADEGVDPVAEADVYMAYGRDAQAEEILLDALKNDPTRTAVYVKLLEIYAQRRSLKQFENVATDLYTQTGGVGDDWAKAAALGLKLDANNPLYKGATVIAGGAAAVAAAEPEEIFIPAEIELPDEEPAASETPAVSFGTNSVAEVRSTWTVPGDMAQLTAGDNAMPVIPEPVASAPLPESINLDFNLDLDSPSTEDQPTQIESRREEEPLPTMEEAVSTHPSELAAAPLEFDIGLDDDVATTTTAGIGSPQLHSVGQETDFDIGIETDGGHDALSEVDLEKTNFEGSLLDFDFELGDEAEKPALDLSNVSLRTAAPEPVTAAPAPAPMAPPPAPAASAPQAAKPVPAPAAMAPIQDNIDVNDEVATKLELAKAYEEMGDVEGARELLEEVITDGADFQKEQAQTMLGRLV